MTEQSQRLQDRLRAENDYLLLRAIEESTMLKATIEKLVVVVEQLHDLITPTSLPKMLTAQQVAELYKVSDSTVSSWVQERRIPFHKIAGTVRFRLEELLEFGKQDSGETSPTIVRLPRSKRLQPGKEQKHAS